MSRSFRFFSAPSPSGWKRSPGRRPRTESCPRMLSRSSATRPGSAPKRRGSKPAGRGTTRAVRAAPRGSFRRPRIGSGAVGGGGVRAARPRAASSSPPPSRRALTPPGRCQVRAPLPGASSASMWRLEKSAEADARLRRAMSSARAATAGGACSSKPAGNRKEPRSAPAFASSSAASASSASLSSRSARASRFRWSTTRGL